jgi:hypothetical protein
MAGPTATAARPWATCTAQPRTCRWVGERRVSTSRKLSPLQELGHDVRLAVVGAHVMDGEDVGVVQRGDSTGLDLEAPQPIGVSGDVLVEDLDGDVAPQPGIASAVDLPHAARTEALHELVGPRREPGETVTGAPPGLCIKRRHYRPGTSTRI